MRCLITAPQITVDPFEKDSFIYKSLVNLNVKIDGFDDEVVHVAAGLKHSVALTKKGQVWTWGCNKRGQLGRSTDFTSPRIVQQLTHECIVQVACGAHHTAALTKLGLVYVWGDDRYGLVPHSQNVAEVFTPLSPKYYESPVEELRSGWTHLLLRTLKGRVFAWGKNDLCQLGRPSAKETDQTPELVPITGFCKMMAVGSEHNVVLTEDNGEKAVVSWGWNEHGICGTGEEAPTIYPTRMSTFSQPWTLLLMGCGSGHTLALRYA